MRSVPSGDPSPGGITGTNANIGQALAGAGPGGAASGPNTSNAIGDMATYGGQIAGAGIDRFGSTVGGQNADPVGIACNSDLRAAVATDPDSVRKRRKKKVKLGTRLTDPSCNTGSGGSNSQGPGNSVNCMSSCCFNAAIFQTPQALPPSKRRCLPCAGMALLSSASQAANNIAGGS